MNGRAADRADMLERGRAVAERVVTREVEIDAAAIAIQHIEPRESLSGLIRQRAVDELVPERESHRRQANAGGESQDDGGREDGLFDDQAERQADFTDGDEAVHPCFLRNGPCRRSLVACPDGRRL